MKKLYWLMSLSVIYLWIMPNSAEAQLPFDEIMMNKGEVCAALLYEHGSWNQYWEGNNLRGNANIGTLTRQMVMPMVVVGISEKLNIIASLPYVSTDPSGGTQVGQRGIQDLSLSLKVEWLQKRLGKGNLILLSNTNFNTPLGNYLSDYLPFSVGLGAPEIGMRGIAGYRMDNGLVFRTAFAYLWRGQTEIERNFYYQDGGVYSNFMNVPNAVNFHAAVGYWTLDNQLRLEGTFMSLNCVSGDDIRAYNAPQPTNKMNISQVGFWGQYYIKGRKGLGAIAYCNYTVNGRNVGKASNLGVGLTYQFQAFAKK
ncbi:transporter [Pararhodonellum marinum]|uniref:transporter n=1 Tax=Pararhodonellum marinum TaxID=2755358 RepID=UPI00188EC0B2|nr:transporter [Pararhodonellum marinum]